MRRVYRVLLPLYREDEMKVEIDQEWLMDCAGCNELNLHLFNKLVFRIAHQWATHIDIDEYCEFLEKLFLRITIRKAVSAKTQKEILCYPTLVAEVIPDVNEMGDNPWAPNQAANEQALWDACLSDEDEKPGYDYKFIEDSGSMTVKKHKKRSPPSIPHHEEDGVKETPPVFVVKEHLNYVETAVYH